MIRVLLADDEQLLRSGFRVLLEATDDITVVDEAANGREAVELARRHRPDVVLMDVKMPVLDGLSATQEIVRSTGGEVRVVVLTTFDLDQYVHEALLAGASGFLLKDLSAAGLADAVRAVASGDALLAPRITRRLIESYRARPLATTRSEELDGLSPREGEIFAEVVAGLSNPEIAAKLHVSEATVKTYVGRLLAKLACRDRVHLVIKGYELGVTSARP